MTFWAKRFVKEAIMREELEKYGAMYRLDDGKYYQVIVEAYNHNEAKRKVKRNISDSSWHEFEPSENIKERIEQNDYLYVYYIGKARD